MKNQITTLYNIQDKSSADKLIEIVKDNNNGDYGKR